MEFENYEYQIVQFDLESYETEVGFVSSPHYLGEDDFMTYSDGNDRISLISNFGSEEYYCTGACYCDDVRRSTRVQSYASKGLVTLVAAASSIIAFEKANEYFNDECTEEYSDSCPGESIVSEVNNCELLYVERKKKKKGKKGKEAEEKSKRKEVLSVKEIQERIEESNSKKYRGQYVEFICSGNCLPKKRFPRPEAVKRAKKFGCEKLKLEEKVRVRYRASVDVEALNEGMVNARARVEFNRIMTPYCRENSVMKYKYQESGSKKKFQANQFACASRPHPKGMNRTYKCRRV